MKIDNITFAKKGIKYEVVKVILIAKLLEKYKNKKTWINIYPELEFDEGLFCSIYFIDIKDNKEIIYHLVKQDVKVDGKYKDFQEKGGLVICININKFSEDINEIEKDLEEVI